MTIKDTAYQAEIFIQDNKTIAFIAVMAMIIDIGILLMLKAASLYIQIGALRKICKQLFGQVLVVV